MTEQLPMTGSRGQPLKVALYLADGKRLTDMVAAYRAAKAVDGTEAGDATASTDRVTGKDEASAEAPVTKRSQLKPDCNKDSAEAPVTGHLNVEGKCNKPKRQSLPPAQYPTEIPGFPLNWDAVRQDGEAKEAPDYRSSAGKGHPCHTSRAAREESANGAPGRTRATETR